MFLSLQINMISPTISFVIKEIYSLQHIVALLEHNHLQFQYIIYKTATAPEHYKEILY